MFNFKVNVSIFLRLSQNFDSFLTLSSSSLNFTPVWKFRDNLGPIGVSIGYALAAITDIIDGRVARGRGLVTNLGKVLDVGCDLILVWSAVALLWLWNIVTPQEHPYLFGLLVFLFARELAVNLLRLRFRVKMSEVQVTLWGKSKTFIFMVGIIVLLTSPVWSGSIAIGAGLLTIVAFCSYVSGFQYIRQFKIIAQSRKENG